MNDFIVDSELVIRTFNNLTSKELKKVYRNSLRKAASILYKETKKLFRTVTKASNHKNWWNGKTLQSGIKLKVDKEATEAKVHIMGDFRLKFFEKGTKERRTRKGWKRGRMPKTGGKFFFRKSKETKELEIFDGMDETISESIKRVFNKR